MGGGGDSKFAYVTFVFAMAILFTMPMMINAFVPQMSDGINQDDLMEDYYDFTGAARGKTSESVWVLTGVYIPYEGGSYGYTEDGWIYGSRVSYLKPSQYVDTNREFDVARDDNNGIYKYASNSADYQPDDTHTTIDGSTVTTNKATGHAKGDLYTSVVFDKDYKSDIFFTKSLKYNANGQLVDNSDGREPFYYEYTGYRYAFQPTADMYTVDADGNKMEVTATTTSLSLIWYSYYRSDGLSGQLVISGNDSGVSYLTSDQIIRAFDSTTSTARFEMTFNGGVKMGIYIKIDAFELANNRTVEECYNLGYWSVMVTSISTSADSYTGTDFTLNVWNIFETMIKLLTFDYSSFNMSPLMGAICSFVIVIPLYASLIALALGSWQAMAMVGILGVVQSIAAIISNWGSIFPW